MHTGDPTKTEKRRKIPARENRWSTGVRGKKVGVI